MVQPTARGVRVGRASWGPRPPLPHLAPVLLTSATPGSRAGSLHCERHWPTRHGIFRSCYTHLPRGRGTEASLTQHLGTPPAPPDPALEWPGLLLRQTNSGEGRPGAFYPGDPKRRSASGKGLKEERPRPPELGGFPAGSARSLPGSTEPMPSGRQEGAYPRLCSRRQGVAHLGLVWGPTAL